MLDNRKVPHSSQVTVEVSDLCTGDVEDVNPWVTVASRNKKQVEEKTINPIVVSR